jgi:hypothetical protein
MGNARKQAVFVGIMVIVLVREFRGVIPPARQNAALIAVEIASKSGGSTDQRALALAGATQTRFFAHAAGNRPSSPYISYHPGDGTAAQA